MKIEAPKNYSAHRKQSKNVYKSEAPVFDRSGAPRTASSIPSPSGGAFAKILEESRRDKNESTTAKCDSAEPDSKTAGSDRDEKIIRAADEKNDAEESEARRGGDDEGEAGESSGENHSPVYAQTMAGSSLSAPETNSPAARSILHIADLERIVSMIRSETLQNQKTVLIALKNSVLQGLQIKLTLDRSGRVKAELLASGEQIKRQLSLRKKRAFRDS